MVDAGAIAMQREFVAQTFGQLPPEKLIAFEELLILTRDLVRAQSSGTEASPQESIAGVRSLVSSGA